MVRSKKNSIIKGTPVSKGYAVGEVYLIENDDLNATDESIETPDKEILKLDHAINKTRVQLQEIKQQAFGIGINEAAIFDAQLMILGDSEFIGEIKENINKNKTGAVKATRKVSSQLITVFDNIEDEYIGARAADIKDVSDRLISNLLNKNTNLIIGSDKTILIAHDLAPSETAQIDKGKVIGLITNIGSKTSHTAIMSRTLGIPAVVGANNITELVHNGDLIILDGIKGEVIINPADSLIEEYKAKISKFIAEQKSLKKYAGRKAKTQDGKSVYVVGNIGRPADLQQVIENGGEGVGLFRTEFLYMDREKEPSEQEQFESYKYVLEHCGENPVVIRTLDIGGDKVLPYFKMPQEDNPFLGYRGIRLCMGAKPLFKTQLRALLKASSYGNLHVMFPMISGVEEYMAAMEIVKECKEELLKEQLPCSNLIKWGVMIEIPSAALCAEELAEHVDFFSIGSNDLTQYTLAVDRMSDEVSYLYNPMHPAVLKLIKLSIEGAHKHGKWIGMCGEMAGDRSAIPTLVKLGLDEFSMSASSIPLAKKIISETCVNDSSSFTTTS